MFNQRDRLLAMLFVVQLVAAVVFGGLLIHTLHDHSKPTETIVSGAAPNGVSDGSTSTTGTGSTSAPGGSSASTTGSKGSSGVSSGNSTTTTNNSTTKSGGNSSPSQGGTGTNPGTTDSAPNGSIKPGAPITVGAIVSEEQNINFTSSAQATQAYIDQVDASGGVNGHQIKLLVQNDQLQPGTGIKEAQTMVNQGAFAFVGFNAPETENEIVPFLVKNKIPLVGGYGEYDEYHSPWSYIFSASYGHYGYEMGKYLVGLGVKTPAFIYIDNQSADANNGEVAAFEAGVKAAGGTVNPKNIFKEEPTQLSYDSIVTSMRLNGVDGFASILDEASDNRLQQSEDGEGYHPTHLADPLWPDANVTHEAANVGTYVATDFRFVNPGVGGAVGDYVSAVKKAFGSQAQINYIGEQGWLDAEIFVDALKQLGTDVTRSALMNVLNKLNEPQGFGFTGPLVPTTTAHNISHCLMFGKWNGTETVPTTNWLCDNQPF